MSSLWSHPPCPSSQIPHPVSYLRTGQTTLMHSLAPGRESVPAASLGGGGSKCHHWRYVTWRAIKRPVHFLAQLCKALVTPVWYETPWGDTECRRRAALGWGYTWQWMVHTPDQENLCSCHVSERRRRDQGGGTRYLTCRPKPSGNNSKWPWRPEDHTN